MPTPSILLVEDNPDDHQILREAFGEMAPDITLLHAGDINSAWALLSEGPERALPSLMITDHHLPDGCGQDLISRVQTCPIRGQLPVVMISGDVSEPSGLGTITWFRKPDTWAGWCALAQRLAGRISER